MSHPWKSRGEKRTVTWAYTPPSEVAAYLKDMQQAITYALQAAYIMTIRNPEHRVPSPIDLRKEIKEWFHSNYDYARHHINPVCRAAVAMLRSYRKNHHGELRIPEVKKLAMRLDAELFKIMNDRIRLTLQPNRYAWLPLNTANKHYPQYSQGRPAELLITNKKICLTFITGDERKPLGDQFVGSDLNFNTIDSTTVTVHTTPSLTGVNTNPITNIARIQNDFSRRRRRIQLHVKNSQKRQKKLRETRDRQRNRITDTLHKLTTETVRENLGASHVFENLKGIRKSGGRKHVRKTKTKRKSKKFRTYLNRWPYRLYQSMVDYKSPKRTLYVNPRGTSSECPVCGDKLEHPTWGISRCRTCGVDYARNRLSSLEIVRRGLRLCGQPFAVSADTSWLALKNEYLHTPNQPRNGRAGWTEPTNAPNERLMHNNAYPFRNGFS